MQNLRWLILLALCLNAVHGTEVVRVVTWNLEWFPGGRPGADQQAQDAHFLQVAAVLPQLRADVIVLQEVRNDEVMQNLCTAMPGFRVHVTSAFKDAFTRKPGDQQISILSRFPADAAWAEPWAKSWANAPRGYAYARLLVGNVPLHVYGLHLKSNLGDPAANTAKREDAMEQLLGHVQTQTQPRERVAVVGDFNTSKEQINLAADRTLRKVEQAGFFWTFEGIPLEHRITIPGGGRYPDACFDHIFTRNLGRPVAMVLKDTPGSDHFPVIVDLAIDHEP
jgi:endonuclease/exonuclease/phosphatase family metal-dependent hydrolase